MRRAPLLASLALLTPVLSAAQPAREMRLVMGTTAVVEVGGLADPRPALDGAFAALQLVDDLMSLWKPSELLLLNEEGRGVVSPETREVLRGALDIARASAGAFDPTLEPLVRAMGGFTGESRVLEEGERRALLRLVGWRRVRVDESGVHLHPGTRLDLGGIAKGYAADLAVAAVKRHGATAAVVDLGSSTLGVFGQPSLVLVREPEGGQRTPGLTFVVQDAFVGTSACDERGAHILDPRTGEPASRGVISATVIARTGLLADALSTALFVLGASDGLATVESLGAHGLVVERAPGGRRRIRWTSGFRQRFSLSTPPR